MYVATKTTYSFYMYLCSRIQNYNKDMATRNRKSVKGESKKEVVKCFIQKPHNFEVYYGRSENPEKNWLDFQKYVMRRNPIKKLHKI